MRDGGGRGSQEEEKKALDERGGRWGDPERKTNRTRQK